jgi:putative peptide zinc metalloprotease protein
MRQTFHESFYRVADLKVRLRRSINIARQFYRGQRWYVVQDQANNAFFRLNQPAYEFVGLLDGTRTVRAAWESCTAKWGDGAPTQGEALQLLGQLSGHNLLETELPPDAAGMFERYKRRRKREIQGRFMNLLFPRIPLLDPDAILETLLPYFGWIFSFKGFLLWIGLMFCAVYMLLNRGPGVAAAISQASSVLQPDNWLLLYAAFLLDKFLHESSHALACKKFGKQSGGTGEVHAIGIMLLVFTPVPYVDASSSWLLKSRWQRAIVGAAGMWMEFALASIAAIIWCSTNPESLLHAFCYNLMFIASVATVFFNGNPFLRYDGYYILSDLLEIPNLLSRSLQYALYLVKKYAFRLKDALNPAETTGQKIWMLIYIILAGVVRVLVLSAIIIFLVRNLQNYPQVMLILSVMAAAAVLTWVVIPVSRCVWYLANSPELTHHRGRAWLVTLGFVAVMVIGLGLIPLPNHCRVEGVVCGDPQQDIYAQTPGFLQQFVPSGSLVHGGANATVLLQMQNPDLDTQAAVLRAKVSSLQVQQRESLSQGDVASAQIYSRQVDAENSELAAINHQLSQLIITAPFSGRWIAPDLHLRIGTYFKSGDQIGTVLNDDKLIVLAAADQPNAGQIIRAASQGGQIRIIGAADQAIAAHVQLAFPGADNTLPSAALSYLAGGPFAPSTDQNQPEGTATPFFMLKIQPQQSTLSFSGRQVAFLAGQRVILRLTLPSETLARQVLEMLQRTLEPPGQTGT